MLNLLIFEMREHLNIYECHFLSELVLVEHQDLAVGVIRGKRPTWSIVDLSLRKYLCYIFFDMSRKC